jgi:hypothetical protein
MQNKESGRLGNAFGRKAGTALAEALGKKQSSRATITRRADGSLAHIKVARLANNRWGVYETVLPQVQFIICALALDSRRFHLWEISVETWERVARQVSSGSPLLGRQRQISTTDAERHGRDLGILDLGHDFE